MKSMQLAALSCMAAASTAAAQEIWYSLVAWEVSQDGGQTWRGGTVEVADPFAQVHIRATGDWFYPGAYAFALVGMDITITYGLDAEINDNVLSPAPIAPFNASTNRTYVATRFGNVIKIDDVRDTLPPGHGAYAVTCRQLAENFNPNFSTAQPAPIFEFVLQLDGSLGTRTVDHRYNFLPGGGEVGPSVYLTPEGALGFPRTILRAPLELLVIPAPATLTLLLPLLALHRRRRP